MPTLNAHRNSFGERSFRYRQRFHPARQPAPSLLCTREASSTPADPQLWRGGDELISSSLLSMLVYPFPPHCHNKRSVL